MKPIISRKGLDKAISDLSYRNPEALKCKLVHAIRGFHEDDGFVESQQGIDAEVLIKALWDTGDDPALIKVKRKNLSSIKSSVNSDLKRLYNEGKNPEGVIIGRNNMFVMSDEVKDKILASFNGSAGDAIAIMGQVAESLSAIKQILPSPDVLADAISSDGPINLEELRSTIQWLAERLDLGGQEAGLSVQVSEDEHGPKAVEDDAGLADDAEVVEEIVSEEEEGAEEVEEAEEIDEGELEEDFEEVGLEDDGEVVQQAEVVEEVLVEEEEPEDLEEADEVEEGEIEEALEEAEVEEDLQQLEAAEILAEAEAEEALEEPVVEEVVEELDDDEALEEVEVIEDIDIEQDKGGADVEVEDGPQEMALPDGYSGEKLSDGGYEEDDKTRQNKVLAETFDGYLGDMERSFNQYLLIPQGEYIVGSKAPKKDEQPERRVRLAPFHVGKFPITNALFEIFVEKTGYKTTAEKLGYATVYYGRLHKKVDDKTGLVKYTFNAAIRCETVRGACWYHPFGPDSTLYNKRNHPVVQVSLEDAMAFAAWTGKRLPTENEWEVAARTANGYVLPWGNEMKSNSCNIEESSMADTTAVNKYIEFENDFGIVDAIGNVLEWTLDICNPPSRVKNSSTYRIVKGGSWISGNDVRLFSRFRSNAESPSNILGFRCVAF